jgi:hypothetical protein
MLKNDGAEVSVFDQAARRASSEQVLNWVKKEDPDILGFSA